MKTKLNTHLLSTLPRVLRMTNKEVSDASGISIAGWYRLAKDPAKITVQQLLGLANGLYVPVGKFFSNGKTDVIGMREDYIVRTDYQKCYYDSDAVLRRIGEGTATSWNKAAEAVGMHWTNVSSSLLAVSRTPITRLLTLCEAFNFDLFEFLVDPNRNAQKRPAGKTARTNGDEKESEGMRAEISSLREDVRKLSATVEDLAVKYESLLSAYKVLEKRDAFGYGVIGMAAEPEP